MQSKGASESDEPYKECVGHVFHRIPLDLEKLAAAGDRLPKGRELEAKVVFITKKRTWQLFANQIGV